MVNCDHCHAKLRRPYVRIIWRKVLPVRAMVKAVVMQANPPAIFRFCSQEEFRQVVTSGEFDQLLKEEFQDL